MTWLGGLQIIAGLCILPVAVLSPRTLAALPLVRLMGPGPMFAAGLMAAGLGQLMLGQLVRAVLDHANAARDLAAISRAKASPRPAPEGRGRRR